jgi:hypothetical protein
LRLRQARTLITRAAKERMAREAITTAVAVAMSWKIGGTVEDNKPEMALGDGMPQDMLEDSQIAQTLLGANAMSTEEAVRLLHPDWDDDRVQEELGKIDGDRETTNAIATRPVQTPEGEPVEGANGSGADAQGILAGLRQRRGGGGNPPRAPGDEPGSDRGRRRD